MPGTIAPTAKQEWASDDIGLKSLAIQKQFSQKLLLPVSFYLVSYMRPDSLCIMPDGEFVGPGRKFVGIGEHLAMRCPCCDVEDVDTRHKRTCPHAGAHPNQHQLLLHTISSTL